MDGIAERVREFARARLLPLHRSLERDPAVQDLVAAAGLPVRAVQRSVARYRQWRFCRLPQDPGLRIDLPDRDFQCPTMDQRP